MSSVVTKIAFLDRDGTMTRELPVSPLMLFHAGLRVARYSQARNYVARLAGKGVRFVWNSRNPLEWERPKGRLHSQNERYAASFAAGHGTAEHRELLHACGIDERWLYPGHPEVIHRKELTKGQAVMAWLNAQGIRVEDSIAFDNAASELEGYPAGRVVAVDSATGIARGDFLKALQLLGLEEIGVKENSTPPERPASPAL